MIYRDCLGVLKNISQIESRITKVEKLLREAYPNLPLEVLLEKLIAHYRSMS